jgi:5-methylcytosine-specific restriction endonuclease McrA
MQSVLVLNASYQPLSIVSARRALQLIRENKATALDGSGRFHNSEKGRIEVPYVVLLNYVVKQGKSRGAAWSRHGVLARDNYNCVYCGKPADTIDHVVPRALGGLSTYDNCVAACKPCNNKKSDRTLEQMGWHVPKGILKAPSPMSSILSRAKRNEPQLDAWKTYITMYEPALASIY